MRSGWVPAAVESDDDEIGLECRMEGVWKLVNLRVMVWACVKWKIPALILYVLPNACFDGVR